MDPLKRRPKPVPFVPAPRGRLGSWKEIAAYLDTTVRTAQRWEKDEGLPAHRHQHAAGSTVYAYRSELDAWREGGRTRCVEEDSAAEPAATSGTPAEQPSIAVLPFVNLSDEKQNEYFSDGLAEGVINALAKVPGLRVTGRTSSFAFRGKEQDLREIGARLNAGSILEGSVQKVGDRVRVTAQLVSAEDGYHLWSERYDREMVDVFAIQDEICEAIADKLRVTLRGRAPFVRRYTENLEAYNLFLQGHYHQYRWTLEGIQKSRAFFEQAVALDPAYALAHVGMAMYHLHMGFFGFQAPKEAIPRCESAVRKALAADDSLSEAHAMLGVLMVVQDFDWEGAEKTFLRALELDPTSADSRNFYDYYFLVPMGRFDESIADTQRTLELDPLSAFLHFRLGFRYLVKRRFDRATEQLRNALELDPGYHAARWALATIYLQEGMLDEALAACEQFAALSGRSPWGLGSLGFAYAKTGRVSEARKLLRELSELSRRTYVPPSDIAKVHFGLGEDELGFGFLEKAVDERDGWIFHLGVDPFYDFLRADQRYHGLLRKMRLESAGRGLPGRRSG